MDLYKLLVYTIIIMILVESNWQLKSNIGNTENGLALGGTQVTIHVAHRSRGRQ